MITNKAKGMLKKAQRKDRTNEIVLGASKERTSNSNLLAVA